MPITSSFNEQYIIDWIRKRFGDPTVAVELDETQIKTCIEETQELFEKYRPKENYIAELYAKGFHLIDPPENAHGLLDAEYVREDYSSYEDVEGALMYDPFYFLSAGGISGIDIQTYDQIRHWIELISREFGSEEGHILLDDGRVFIQLPGMMRVTLKWAMPYAGLEDVHRPYQMLFTNLVLAKCRIILGSIRGKFASVPGAGGAVQMDGDYQRDKGERDEIKWTDELMRISPHFIPTMG